MHTDTQQYARRLAEISDRLLAIKWRMNPAAATALGIHDYDCTLGEFSPEAFQQMAADLRSCRRALQSDIDPTHLSPDDYTDYQLAMSLASLGIIRLECLKDWERDPSFYPARAMWGIHVLLAGDFEAVENRARCVLSRLKEIPGILDAARWNLTNASNLFTEIGMTAADGSIRFLRAAIPSLAAGVPAMEDELLAANAECITALDAYWTWLQNDLLPGAQAEFRIGTDLYEQIVFTDHLLTYSPDHLLRLGQGALINAREELTEIAGKIDPSASWQDLIERLKHQHPSAVDLLPSYQAAVAEARDFVSVTGLVTFPGSDSLEVLPTPEFERSIIPHAAYMPPPPFDSGGRPGHFWITPPDDRMTAEEQELVLQSHSWCSMPVTTLHESYPGHHLQLCIGNEAGRPMRKQSMSHIFAEGWGLYCEEMMYEQGFYSDPEVRLFQLRGSLYHACQVVIDVGIQTGTMTVDEGVRMLVDTVRFDEAAALSEVRRYAVQPTQAMTNAIGKLLILAIREEQKRRLGSAFDLARFHDQMLSYGTIPTSLIAERFARDPIPHRIEHAQAA